MTMTEKAVGHDSRFCGARTRSGSACRRPAGWGTSHPGCGTCKLHLGSTSTLTASAHATALEARIGGELRRIGIQPVTDPARELARIVGEQVAFLDLARAKLAEVTDSWTRDNPITGAEEVRAAVTVYERAIDRTTNALDRMCRLGIQDRIAAANQLTAQTYAAALAHMIHLARTTDDPPEQIILEAIGEDQ
ncbi:MAG: hypothetical protein E6Z04_09590 [Cutibacterium avidum]|nr:hypothetical protein [Cutibacterium avidum]